MVDRDHSGYVDSGEIRQLMQLLLKRDPAGAEVEAARRTLDGNNDGKVEYAEFQAAMREWLVGQLPAAAGDMDAATAMGEGKLAGAAAAVDSTAAGGMAGGAAFRKAAHAAISAYFSEFAATDSAARQRALAAEIAAYTTSASAALGSGGGDVAAPLIDGPDGLWRRASPLAGIAVIDSEATRAAALAFATATAAELPVLTARLAAPGTVAGWAAAADSIARLLAVAQLFDYSGVSHEVRDMIIGFYDAVATSGAPAALLALVHPGAAVAAGLPVVVHDLDTLAATTAVPVQDAAAAATAAALDAAMSSLSGSKRRRTGGGGGGGGSDSEAEGGSEDRPGKRRAVAILAQLAGSLRCPQSVASIHYSAGTPPAIPTVTSPPTMEEWAQLQVSVARVLLFLCLGPRLPYTPASSFWHPTHVHAGMKALIMSAPAVPWILHHIMYDDSSACT